MKAAVLNAIPGQLDIEDVTIDAPGPREVLVRTAAAVGCVVAVAPQQHVGIVVSIQAVVAAQQAQLVLCCDHLAVARGADFKAA